MILWGRLFELEKTVAPEGLVFPAEQEKVGNKIEEQHMKILHAIEMHNGEFAYFYMKEHMTYISQIYREYFEMLEK